MKEKQPAPPISNQLEIIHSDKEEESEESEEADDEDADEEEQDESEEENDEGDEGEGEDNEGEGNEEGKRAIIEGEPDPPYMDEAEPGLFSPYIQRDGQHITEDDKNNKRYHY